MKRLLCAVILFGLSVVIPLPATAEVSVGIGIALPPPIVFPAPPEVVVLPDTNAVYVVPGIDIDLFFWNGWWWRFWEGRWYRSHYYNRGWGYYNYVPRFYYDVDPGWRGYYRDHDWHGHRWNYQPIPEGRLEHNWRTWQNTRHWERQGTWGVEGYHSSPPKQRQQLRHERQHQYQQRPDVQRHQQQMRQQQRQQQQPRQHSQPRGQERGKSHGKPDGGDKGHGR